MLPVREPPTRLYGSRATLSEGREKAEELPAVGRRGMRRGVPGGRKENVITGDHANLTPTSLFTSVQPLDLIRLDFF